ncbi:MAG: D-2-hydroxyacid dehydrogenase [Pseudomonadota bacterium]
MTRPILVAHTDPSEVASALTERFPDQAFEFVTHGSMVGDALAALDPEVVFSIAGPAFRRDAHEVMMAHPSLKWLQVGGSGYDHLPFEWDRERITVTHCAGVLSQYLAETITGAMLALNGHFLRYRALQSIGEWRPIPFKPLAGQTLLVVGFGAIGQRLAHNARALGMTVLATRNTPAEHPLADEVHGPDRDTLLTLLPRADFISVHLRLNHDTKRSFDADCFAAMKQGAVFINTARGKVVDTDALLAALNEGKLMGAYLDVFDAEPLPPEHPLWRAPNTLITPHTADNVLNYPGYYARFFADNLARYKAGETLDNLVG